VSWLPQLVPWSAYTESEARMKFVRISSRGSQSVAPCAHPRALQMIQHFSGFAYKMSNFPKWPEIVGRGTMAVAKDGPAGFLQTCASWLKL
jgi:hypothetical protein